MFTLREIVEMFPGAKSTLKQMIKDDERTLREHENIYDDIYNFLQPKVPMDDLDFATALAFACVRSDYVEIGKGSTEFKNLLWIKDRLEKNKKILNAFERNYDGSGLERAKAYPIENLVKLNYKGWAKCPLHGERTPSFKVDVKNNKWHCFGCNEHGDVLDLYQKLKGVDLKTAIYDLGGAN